MNTCALEAPFVKHSIWLDHLSFSSINMYQACPKKFAFKYIERAAEEFTPSYFAFGGAFHRAVERIHEALIVGAPLPQLDELLDAYDRAWSELLDERPMVKFAKDEDTLMLRMLAMRMLSAFREHSFASPGSGSQIIAIEESVRFRLLADAPPIEMRLDLLELRGTDLVVTDFKTSKCRWSDKKVAESLQQLVLYAHGLLPLLKELGATRLVPRFVVISKAKKPVVQVLEPQATQSDADALKRTIGDTWKGIEKGDFRACPGWHCSLCTFQNRCKSHGG